MNGLDTSLATIDRLLAQGQPAAATRLAEQAVAAGNPRLAVCFRLVVLYLKQGRYRDAQALMAAAAANRPTTPEELIELGQRLAYFNLGEALARVARRMLDEPVWHAPAEGDFAALLSMAGEQELAAKLLDRAIARVGATPPRLYNRSQMRMYSGRMAEAEGDLRECLRLDPGMAKSYWALSKLPQAQVGEADLERMGQLALRLPAGSQDEIFLRFAQFNLLDRLGRHEQAWTALEQGCRSKRAALKYDAAGAVAYIDRLVAAGMTASGSSHRGEAGLTPVFIVGMHRSGTTLLERILGGHSRVAEGGELYDFPAELRMAVGQHFPGPSAPVVLERQASIDFHEVGRRYLERVRWRAGDRPFLVDKLPSNFLNIGYLAKALPGAKILHMRRHAMDTCFSNLKELFSSACAYSYDQIELADYFAAERRLMRHWHRQLPGYVLEVSYEELTADPAGQARRVLEFCGLEWQAGCLALDASDRAVNTASSAQVREPIHRRSVEAWRRYGPQLEPLRHRLAELGELDGPAV